MAVHVAVKSLLPGEGLLAVVAGQGIDLIVGLHLMASQVVLLNELLSTGLKQGDFSHYPLLFSLSIMYLNTVCSKCVDKVKVIFLRINTQGS